MARKAKINRKPKETNIVVEANLDGKGIYTTQYRKIKIEDLKYLSKELLNRCSLNKF